MPFFYYGSWDYIWLILLAAVLGMAAQAAVQGTYRKYASVAARSGVTADEAARYILQEAGVYDVSIGFSRGGGLSDHYDPRALALPPSPPLASPRTRPGTPYSTRRATRRWPYATPSCPWSTSAPPPPCRCF